MRWIVTPGVSIGTSDHRLLLVPGRGRIGLTHEDRDLAARIAGAGDPPLAAVEDYSSPSRTMLAWMFVASEDATVGLGHRKARADLARQQRLQPALPSARRCRNAPAPPCCRCPAPTVEHLGRHRERAAHDFAERRVLQVRKPGAALASGRNRFHKPAARAFGFQLSMIGDRLPAVAFGNLGCSSRSFG